MHQHAGLAQLVERKTLNLVVEGSSPSLGEYFFLLIFIVLYERFLNTVTVSMLTYDISSK